MTAVYASTRTLRVAGEDGPMGGNRPFVRRRKSGRIAPKPTWRWPH